MATEDEDRPEDDVQDEDTGTEDRDEDTGTGTGDEDGKADGKDESELARARREAARYRRQLREAQAAGTKAQQDAVKKVLAALGVQETDDVDPAKLQEMTKTQAAKLRATQVELAVLKAAGRAGADPDALVDSRSFMDGLADLDPADPDFSTQVVDEIKKAVKKNPRLGRAQVAGSSGGEHRGGSGTGNSGDSSTEENDPEASYKAVLKRRTTRR